jgi:hypothetical protein
MPRRSKSRAELLESGFRKAAAFALLADRDGVTKRLDVKILQMFAIKLARLQKFALIEQGMRAVEAHRQAADEAASRLGKHKINLSANTIARRMESER